MKDIRLLRGLTTGFAALLLYASCALPVWSGDAAAPSQARLLRDIKHLSSDELEGRGVGLKGLDLAADYIRDQFVAAGLKCNLVDGKPFQTFSMHVGAELAQPNNLELFGPHDAKFLLSLNTDFVPQSFGGSGAFAGGLAFCGYGIVEPEQKYDDFAGLDLKGKVAIIMRRTPQQANPHGLFAGRHGGASTHGELRTKVSNAFDRGVAAILFVNDPFTGRKELEQGKQQVARLAEAVAEAAVALEAADAKTGGKYAEIKQRYADELAKYKSGKAHLGDTEPDTLMKFGYAGSEPMRDVPVIHVTRAAIDRILQPALGKTLAELETAIDKDVRPHSALLPGYSARGQTSIERKQAEVKNVIASLEASGPTANETIVIGAHYDHVGRGGPGSLAPGSTDIHNGADDNASGAAALLELARRLALKAPRMPRRIVFIAFTGEETGLIGSARYVREPIFPLEQTIAMLNMDMVGRLKDDKLTVFGVGTSPVWEKSLERLGNEFQLKMNFKPEGFGPSDHSSFYSKHIPVLHFFTGTHSDYHRPTDDWDKVNIAGEERIVDLIEKLVIELATTPERPQYVEVKGTAQISERDGARPYFGSIPDFGGDKPGYLLSGVAPGSPADKGGLRAGDLIVQLGASRIQNLEDFDLALRRFTPGDTVDVTVMRESAAIKLKVTLAKPRGG